MKIKRLAMEMIFPIRGVAKTQDDKSDLIKVRTS